METNGKKFVAGLLTAVVVGGVASMLFTGGSEDLQGKLRSKSKGRLSGPSTSVSQTVSPQIAGPTQPDLTAQNLRLSSSGDIVVTLKNLGTAVTSNAIVRFTKGTPALKVGRTASNTVRSANSSVDVVVIDQNNFINYTGSEVYEVCVDESLTPQNNNQVAESNENNNCVSSRLSDIAPNAFNNHLPDLRVTGFQLNTNGDLTASISNTGNGSINSSETVFYKKGSGWSATPDKSFYNSGASKDYVVVSKQNLSNYASTDTYEVCIDHNPGGTFHDSVLEENENNNCSTIVFGSLQLTGGQSLKVNRDVVDPRKAKEEEENNDYQGWGY